VLRFPAHLPERLGHALVERIRAGGGEAVAAALVAGDPRTPEAELAILAREARVPRPVREHPEAAEIRPGVRLADALRGRTLTLRLTGEGVGPALQAEIRRLLGAG